MWVTPLQTSAVFFATGIVLADAAAPVPVGVAAAAALAIALSLPGRSRVVGLRPAGRAVATALLFLAAGYAAMDLRLSDVRAVPFAMDAVCGGRVSATRALSSGRSEVRMRVARCRSGSHAWRGGLVVYADTVPGGPGAILVAMGRLEPPAGARNPGEPDRQRLELRRGYGAVLSVRDSIMTLRSGSVGGSMLRSVRDRLARRVRARHPGPDIQSVMLALLTGRSAEIPRKTRDAFRQSGLAHVLAVSGLHVGIIGSIALLLVAAALRRVSLAPTASLLLSTAAMLLVLCGLVLVIGPRASVVRASLMGGLLVVRRPLQRSGPGLRDALALAMMLQLAVDPAALFDAGFQLSHSAVLGLSFVRRSGKTLLDGLAASTAATLATAPFVAWHFGPVPLGGLLTNLAGLPLTALTVTAGVIGLLPGLTPVSAAASLAARLLVGTATMGSSALGWFRLVLQPGRLFALVVVVVAAIALVRSSRGRVIAAAVLAGLILAWPASRMLQVVFLDVGQGDAAVLHLPDGRTALVDTGTPSSTALPRYLSRHGIRTLATVVVTHDHADHAGGLTGLTGSLQIDRLVSSSDSGGRPVLAADTLDLGPDLRVYVLAPRTAGDGNESSLVLSLAFGQTRFLLLGDAEKDVERQVVSVWPDLLRSDVVKVGHHGSRTSSTPSLVRRATRAGTVAVVSVGRRNRFGHPDADVLSRWKDAGAVVLPTSTGGAVCIRSDGRTVRAGCR